MGRLISLVFFLALITGPNLLAAFFFTDPANLDEVSLSPKQPFSDAVRVGNIICLSGQLGNVFGEPRLVEGGMQEQAKQAIENIERILNYFKLELKDVFKCTVMLADINDWATFNKVYLNKFSNPLPTRSAFGAAGLALGAKVELECWAAIPAHVSN